MTPVERAVRKGANEISKHQPENWPDQIDLSTLDMTCTKHCVLGQLYGDLRTGYETLWPGCMDRVTANEDGENGFNASEAWGFEDLQRAWVAEINYRRTAGQKATS